MAIPAARPGVTLYTALSVEAVYTERLRVKGLVNIIEIRFGVRL